MVGMLPSQMPVVTRPPVVLRAFRDDDVGLVQSVAGDPLIPLITTVPASGEPPPGRIRVTDGTLQAITRRAGRGIDEAIRHAIPAPDQARRVAGLLEELAALLLCHPEGHSLPLDHRQRARGARRKHSS
jgi:hypothetical protein